MICSPPPGPDTSDQEALWTQVVIHGKRAELIGGYTTALLLYSRAIIVRSGKS